MKERHVKEIYIYIYCISIKERHGWVWSGRFIVLNDSAGPKMVLKMYFNFFRFS